ncbi:MAG: cytochrome c biogenesis protein DipZ [Alphaproteobacteria bacterium]|jgi:cytochrome c biogenesis protein CcdA/thiol-disulfide isomerase/thioredoxin|nr:cytochrome c biogenesis protein DipZ [Alphaproteobacteria bacterium]
MMLSIISYLAGMLTIVSPCILPVLPFVFARADRPFLRHTLPLLAGMAVTFAAVTTLGATVGAWAAQVNEIGRYVAIAALALFGLTLVSPHLAAFFTRPIVALGNRLSVRAGDGIGGSVLLGIATGLLWAPCAGPVLGLILTGAAARGTGSLLVAYGAGAATSLALAVLAGGRVLLAMKRSLGFGVRLRQGLGGAVLAAVCIIALGLDSSLLARLSYAGTAGIEQSLLQHSAAPQPRAVEGGFPSLAGATAWLNSGPLTAERLRGKTVLVNFWTYSCINCIRSLPYVDAWAEKYRDKGLVVIGVHTPEFAFEKIQGNVERAIRRFHVAYPVAIDSEFRIWRAFANNYWPAQYLIDAEGRIRYHNFGEGHYRQTEEAIQALLSDSTGRFVAPRAKAEQAAPDLTALRSGETYVGYRHTANFASPEGIAADRERDYTIGPLAVNRWALDGSWTIAAERAISARPGGAILFRFSARDLHLVLGIPPDGRPVRFQVTIDGRAPGPDHGTDIDAQGHGTITETRLYQLVRQSDEMGPRLFEIRFLDAEAEAYAFTFG